MSVSPSRSPLYGGVQVVITGTVLGEPHLVTLCNISANIISSDDVRVNAH